MKEDGLESLKATNSSFRAQEVACVCEGGEEGYGNTSKRDILLKGLSEITTFAKSEMLPATYLHYLKPTSDREKSSMNNNTKQFLEEICNCPVFDLSFPLLEDLFTPYPSLQSFFPWKPSGMCLMLTGFTNVLLMRDNAHSLKHTSIFHTLHSVFICVSYFSFLNNYCKLRHCLKYSTTDNYMEYEKESKFLL